MEGEEMSEVGGMVEGEEEEEEEAEGGGGGRERRREKREGFPPMRPRLRSLARPGVCS
jgi:hypothetical protein